MKTIYCKVESNNKHVISNLKNILENNLKTTDEKLINNFRSFTNAYHTDTVKNVFVTILESSDWYISFSIEDTKIAKNDFEILVKYLSGNGSVEVEEYNSNPSILWVCRNEHPCEAYLHYKNTGNRVQVGDNCCVIKTV